MIMTAEVAAGQLVELVKQVQAGNEVLLTQGNRPVARIVPTGKISPPDAPVEIRSITGHRVLTPSISQSELAQDEEV